MAFSNQYFASYADSSINPAFYGEPTSKKTVSRVGEDFLGQPIPFASGQWEGRVIRAELHELQKADRGRKYADVDRRTLDPPPVVTLRLFDVFQDGSHFGETEITSYDGIQTNGLLCAAELIPVDDGFQAKDDDSSELPSTVYPYDNYASNPESPGFSTNDSFVDPSHLHDCTVSSLYSSTQNDITHLGAVSTPTEPNIAQLTQHSLIGSKVIQAQHVELNNQHVLVFVFSDLAVRELGSYRFRYTCFDLFSRVENCPDVMIQAACYGGPFHVFPAKKFPGLPESTELTKILSLQGFALNVRYAKREPKRKKQINKDEEARKAKKQYQ